MDSQRREATTPCPANQGSLRMAEGIRRRLDSSRQRACDLGRVSCMNVSRIGSCVCGVRQGVDAPSAP